MEYKNIKIYRDADSEFLKAEVVTNLGKLEILDEDKFKNLISEFAKQEKISIDDLLKNKELVKTVVDIDFDEEEDYDEDEELEKDAGSELNAFLDEVEFDVENKKGKKKKKGLIKKLIAYVTIAAILITGGTVLVRSNKFAGKIANFFKKGKIETPINNNQTITVLDSGNNSNSDYDNVMDGVISRQEQSNEAKKDLASNKVVELTYEQILSVLNDNARIANSSMFEISEYINGKELRGKAYYNKFESNFNQNTMDYKMVKLFSDMRNELLRLAYEEKDRDASEEKIRDFYSLYVELVTLEKECRINIDGKEVLVNFSNLSSMAKASILELGVAMFTMNLNYNYYSDDISLTKLEVINSSTSLLEGEIIPSLINKGYSR